MTELKPCPFCGGEAKVQSDLWPRFVYCQTCNARTVNITDFGDEGTDKAVSKWNQRVDNSRNSIPIDWLNKLRKDNRIGLDELETIDWIISEWCSEQED